MIEIRGNCENCDAALAANSDEAMICGFECTYCKTCVETVLKNVCPNCGGGFEKRPIMPKRYLEKYPPSKTKVLNPVDLAKFQKMLDRYQHIKPSDR